MREKYRVHDLVKFDYSEIGKYTGEGYTDTPLRNDEIVKLLNENEQLKKENNLLKIKKTEQNILFTEQELSKILNTVFSEYTNSLITKMTFSEFVIIESLLIKLQNHFKELAQKKQNSSILENITAMIKGIEDEKNIDPNNEQFQYAMNTTLKYLRRLKEDADK